MSALELFRFLGEDLNRPPSPPKNIRKRQKATQSQQTTRYWPGKVKVKPQNDEILPQAPEYARDAQHSSDDSDSDLGDEAAQAALENDRRYSRYANTEDNDYEEQKPQRTRARADVITIERKTDPDQQDDKDLSSNDNVTSKYEQDGLLSPDTEAPKSRNRDEIRSRAMAYRKEEEQIIQETNTEEVPSEDEEYSDSDSDYAEEERKPQQGDSEGALEKPLFVSKKHRLTVLEKQELEKEEQRKRENERLRAQERRKQSKQLLIKTLVEEEAQKEAEDPVCMVDDTDVMDQKEYELWKIRELKRIIRDREERTAHDRLAADVERRRNMTEEERLLDNERIDSTKVKKAPRSRMQFLQKYYHKGAFFMDKLEDGSEPVYNRDYNAPTADDCIDKSMLPKPMQVRRGKYGKVGQTKYTHLTAEDTTRFDMPWTKEKPKFTPAGTKNEFDRPSRKGEKRSRS